MFRNKILNPAEYPKNLTKKCGIAQPLISNGVSLVPSPMIARTGLTQEGKESEHTMRNTGPRRFLVVEFDTGGIDDYDAGRNTAHCGDNAADGQRLRRRQYGQRLHQAARTSILRFFGRSGVIRMGREGASWCGLPWG